LGQVIRQGFDELSGVVLGLLDELLGESVVVDRIIDVVVETRKGMGEGERDIGEEGLLGRAFLVGYADEARELETLDRDGVRVLMRGGAHAFHDLAEHLEVRHHHVGIGLFKLRGAVVAREDSDGRDTGAVGGGDVMLHVADESGFLRFETVLDKEVADVSGLVTDAGVDGFKVVIDAHVTALDVKGLRVNAGEDETTDALGLTEVQEVKGVRDESDRLVRGLEGIAEVILKLIEVGLGEDTSVIVGVRELELVAELLAVKRGAAVLSEDVVRGFQSESEVVNERARPVEDDVFEHGRDRAPRSGRA
jgi:hypothetical protein